MNSTATIILKKIDKKDGFLVLFLWRGLRLYILITSSPSLVINYFHFQWSTCLWTALFLVSVLFSFFFSSKNHLTLGSYFEVLKITQCVSEQELLAMRLINCKDTPWVFLINFLDKASSVTHVVEKTLINYNFTINSEVTDCFVYLCFCELFFKVDKCNIIHVWNEFVSFLGLILELINNNKFHLLLSVSFSILLMLLLSSSLFSLQ